MSSQVLPHPYRRSRRHQDRLTLIFEKQEIRGAALLGDRRLEEIKPSQCAAVLRCIHQQPQLLHHHGAVQRGRPLEQAQDQEGPQGV